MAFPADPAGTDWRRNHTQPQILRLLLAPLRMAERGRISPSMTAHMLRAPLRSHSEQVPQHLSWAVPTQWKIMAAACCKSSCPCPSAHPLRPSLLLCQKPIILSRKLVHMKFLSKPMVSLLNLSFLIVQQDSAVQRTLDNTDRVGTMLGRKGRP